MKLTDKESCLIYLFNILDKLSYYIDVKNYKMELSNIVFWYNFSLKNLFLVEDVEKILENKLSNIKLKLGDYILFLDLIDMTNNWDYDENVNILFDQVVSSFYKLLNLFSDKRLNKLVIERYYDLLFKKMWVDYLNDDYYLLYCYNNLNKYYNLKVSVYNFLDYNGIGFNRDIDEYSLIDFFNIIGNYFQLPLIDDVLIDNSINRDIVSKKCDNKRIFDKFSKIFISRR